METKEKSQIDEKDKINTKDIYNTLWKCRDFELSNLWQRSIFLTAFLVLCFTAYGAVLTKLFEKSEQTSFVILNIIAYAISLLGIIFSILWIKMGKGSKAWYEKYENAINAFATNPNYFKEEAKKIGGFSYDKLENYEDIEVANCIMSTKAGAYSVSKINIAIGQVFLILWSIIGITHLIVASLKIGCIDNSNLCSIIFLIAGILILFILLLIISSPKRFQSKHI